MGRRILIVRTDRVGDVVMITPMIREIRKAFPDCFLATLTRKNTSDILINNPYLDKILIDDLEKGTFRKVTKELRSFNFTDGLLVLPTERAAYQMLFAGIKNRIGVGRKLYEVITFMKSVSRNKYIPLKHEADYCMDIARRIGVRTDNLSPEIFLTDEEKQWGIDFLRDNGINDDEYKIIIHSGSKYSAPNWSEDKYFELIKEILNKYNGKNFRIILTAYEMSDEFLNKIKSLNDRRIIDIAQKIISLRDLIKVINSVDLVIVSSTGPAHIADSLRKSAIVIHCHRSMNCSKYWGTLNKKTIDLEVSDEHCEKYCSNDKEICDIENGISIDDVLENIIL